MAVLFNIVISVRKEPGTMVNSCSRLYLCSIFKIVYDLNI